LAPARGLGARLLSDTIGLWSKAGHTSEAIELSDDRLMQILQALAVLLFVSVGALSLGRARYAWMKWARWGSIAVFAVAVVFALILTLRWAFDRAL
jgi:membrane protein YdbS with pleckstrin-like domain